MAKEPINLREWIAKDGGQLFTCGRPGRGTFGREKRNIAEDIIDLWISGLPTGPWQIVSLLGSKKGGYSEFAYYPFKSSLEIGSKPSFQEWLNARYGPRFTVHEFPTVDATGIPNATMERATQRIRELLRSGQSVLLVDSAGCERTARICESMGYKVVR